MSENHKESIREVLESTEKDYRHDLLNLATCINGVNSLIHDEDERIYELKDLVKEYAIKLNDYSEKLKSVNPHNHSNERMLIDRVINSIEKFNDISDKLQDGRIDIPYKNLKNVVTSQGDKLFNAYASLCYYMDVEFKKSNK